MSFFAVRSPEAPKITSTHGSGRRRTRNPSSSGFASETPPHKLRTIHDHTLAGVDLALLLATGTGPMVLSQSAWMRILAKGTLTAVKSGKLTLYRAAISCQQAQRGELLYALKHAFNGALAPMVQCLLDTEELSPEQLAELESLIKAKRKGAKPRE